MIRSPILDVLTLVVVMITAIPPSAMAEGPDPAAGEALFRSAREAIDRGNWPEGCSKFEASMALMPSASTLLNISKCHEHDGRVATAWADAKRALVLNRDTQGDERRLALEAVANATIARLEPRLPKLLITSRAYDGLTLSRDDQPLLGAALGEALPVDPGSHVITASAPRHLPWKRTITVEEGKTSELEVIMQGEPPGYVNPSKPVDERAPAAASRGGIPAVAWIVGAAGIAFGATSAGFAIDEANTVSTIAENCPRRTPGGPPTCDPTKFDAPAHNARKNRDLGLAIGFGAGSAIAIGSALILIVTASPAKPPRAPSHALTWLPIASYDGGGLLVGGGF